MNDDAPCPHPPSFADYASLPGLTDDETYTVELLIERVRSTFDPHYWDDWLEQGDARRAPGYQPRFSQEHVLPAAQALQEIDWLSLQRIRGTERPVRDLRALRGLAQMSALVLTNNEVADITPLPFCPRLRKLHLDNNPVRDLTPLAQCTHLESLSLKGIPAEDFSPLQDLPKLRELEISRDQLPAFTRLSHLPALRKLTVGSGKLESFCDFSRFPDMPELRIICGADAASLEGLERFTKLENLVNLSGSFDSLEPLHALHALTHINILDVPVSGLEPLRKLLALREFILHSSLASLDLTPLESLPALHDASIKCAKKPHPALERLRAELTSWDVEFRSATPRFWRSKPSIRRHSISMMANNIITSKREKTKGCYDRSWNGWMSNWNKYSHRTLRKTKTMPCPSDGVERGHAPSFF